jgi:glucose-6-phosphate dehydrogenase assembly protein OpcA
MSDNSCSDAFLSGQGIPVDLSKIDTALSDLWGAAAVREGGPEVEAPAVTRVSLANLVVADLESSLSDEILDTVVARYPCRAIVIRRDEAIGRKVAAEITALCHLPAPGMPQVCSERIMLKAGRDGLDLIPGAVRPLLEADQPIVFWSVGDPRNNVSLFRELAAEANRTILELADPAAEVDSVRAALDLTVNPFGRDLSWFGATRWRELTAQFFDPAGSESYLSRIRTVSITAEATQSGAIPRVSAWLAAWLAGQLGWVPKKHTQTAPSRNVATFSSRSGDVTVTFTTELDSDAVPARLSTVTMSASEDDGESIAFRLVRLGDQVVVEVDGHDHPRLPRMVQAPEFTQPDRVSAALESARDDPPYRNALANMIWLIEGGIPS